MNKAFLKTTTILAGLTLIAFTSTAQESSNLTKTDNGDGSYTVKNSSTNKSATVTPQPSEYGDTRIAEVETSSGKSGKVTVSNNSAGKTVKIEGDNGKTTTLNNWDGTKTVTGENGTITQGVDDNQATIKDSSGNVKATVTPQPSEYGDTKIAEVETSTGKGGKVTVSNNSAGKTVKVEGDNGKTTTFNSWDGTKTVTGENGTITYGGDYGEQVTVKDSSGDVKATGSVHNRYDAEGNEYTAVSGSNGNSAAVMRNTDGSTTVKTSTGKSKTFTRPKNRE